jgi:hypothetical protein
MATGRCDSAHEALQKLHIVVPRQNVGAYLTICPQCSHLRRKKRNRCLSVKITTDAVLYHCFHCDWKGAEFYGQQSARHEGRRGFRNPRDQLRDGRAVRNLYR